MSSLNPRRPVGGSFAAVTALLSLPTLIGLSAAPTAQAAGSAVGEINIIASHSGRCVEAEGSAVAPGAGIVQAECAGQAGAVWRLEESAAGGGSVSIVNVNSDKCLEMRPADAAGISVAQLGTCTGTAATSFLVDDRTEHVWLKSMTSSPNKCLEVAGGSHAGGTALRLAECNGQSGVSFHQRLPRVGNDQPREPQEDVERVNLKPSGAQAPGGLGTSYGSDNGSLSHNGRYIAFEAPLDNLVDDDTNGKEDTFVRDRVTGGVERISVSSSEAQGNGESHTSSISADGRFVAFSSAASNLVPGDVNNAPDIFVRDRQAGTTTRITQSAAGSSTWPSISPDGRFVVFSSSVTDLVPGDTNGKVDAFLYDRTTGATERVSVTDSGGQPNGDAAQPTVSRDGKYVAFSSRASNMTPGDTDIVDDVYLRDRVAGTTKRASVPQTPPTGKYGSFRPVISADGAFVAFHSFVDLIASDTDRAADVYTWNRRYDRLTEDSVTNDGHPSPGYSTHTSISADGRYVVFSSSVSNLVSGDTNGQEDVFVRDRLSGTTVRVNVTSNGVQGNGHSAFPAISGDGRSVLFQAGSTNLVSGDTNNAVDLFVAPHSTA